MALDFITLEKIGKLGPKKITYLIMGVILILGLLFMLVGYQMGVNMCKAHYEPLVATARLFT
jgi:hypothetical protein